MKLRPETAPAQEATLAERLERLALETIDNSVVREPKYAEDVPKLIDEIEDYDDELHVWES